MQAQAALHSIAIHFWRSVMTIRHHPVLIAGAGPTGLTAAMELSRMGVPVRLIDKLTAPSATSRALAVQARTLELLQQRPCRQPVRTRQAARQGRSEPDSRKAQLCPAAIASRDGTPPDGTTGAARRADRAWCRADRLRAIAGIHVSERRTG